MVESMAQLVSLEEFEKIVNFLGCLGEARRDDEKLVIDFKCSDVEIYADCYEGEGICFVTCFGEACEDYGLEDEEF